ncbi:1809_t:CDS:2 [Ambispora leptoticha]|uniref:1809_t:CDS:1 n=1 Tax=Ambispora leptoticha TaxID=144679 RepID=A0A9N9A6I6_9GLOM|nr:1809_t:CDS:2 [Ambispora leptoticha]
MGKSPNSFLIFRNLIQAILKNCRLERSYVSSIASAVWKNASEEIKDCFKNLFNEVKPLIATVKKFEGPVQEVDPSTFINRHNPILNTNFATFDTNIPYSYNLFCDIPPQYPHSQLNMQTPQKYQETYPQSQQICMQMNQEITSGISPQLLSVMLYSADYLHDGVNNLSCDNFHL